MADKQKVMATVGAPGSKQVAAGVLSGTIEIAIVAVSTQGDGRKEAICRYPDGFSRTHQVVDIDDLKTKITEFLWGRYAVVPTGDIHVPTIKKDSTITLEVNNGGSS